MADPEMDEFAQTRGADDLFDDEIIPVSAEEQQTQTEVIAPEPEPAVQEVHVAETAEKASPRGDAPQRGRGGERGRRRGRGKGRGGRESEQKRAESSPRKKNSNANANANANAPATAREPSPKPEKADEVKETGSVEEGNGQDANSEQRVPAVRGDRSATGGTRKPKLTEEELAKRIAAAKKNAVKKAAAHARAEADQASFMEREQEAAKKRREELAHRRVMDNEREQNRLRKLKAQTGREWDSQKREEDYNPRGGGSQFRRGMHGGVSGYARRDFEESRPEETVDNSGQRGRGRGGRGGRGRGSPRAAPGERSSSKGLSGSMWADSPAEAGLDDKNEFPALPEAPKKESKPETKIKTKIEPKAEVKAAPAPSKSPATLEKLDSTFSPITGSWADQFEDDE